MVDGDTTPIIGARLGLSEVGINSYISQIILLDVHSLVDMVRMMALTERHELLIEAGGEAERG